MQVMRLVNNVGSKVEERGSLWGGVLAQRGVDATTQFGVEMFTFILLGGELGTLSAISTGVTLTNETE